MAMSRKSSFTLAVFAASCASYVSTGIDVSAGRMTSGASFCFFLAGFDLPAVSPCGSKSKARLCHANYTCMPCFDATKQLPTRRGRVRRFASVPIATAACRPARRLLFLSPNVWMPVRRELQEDNLVQKVDVKWT